MEEKEGFKIIDISVVERKVTVMETVWSMENIIKLLKQIEKVDGFVGFKQIHFEVNEYPVIEYISKLTTK